VEKLHSEKESLAKEYSVLLERNTLVSRYWDTAVTERNVAREEVQKLRAACDQQAVELEATKTARGVLSDERDQLREALVKAQGEHQVFVQDLGALRHQMATAKATLDATRQENKDLRQALHQAETKNGALDSALRDEQMLVERWMSSHESALDEAAWAVSEMDQVSRENANLERNNAILTANAAEQEQRIVALHQRIKELEEQVQQAQIREIARSPAMKKSAKPHAIAVLNTSPVNARRRSLSAGAPSVSTSADEASENSDERAATRRSRRLLAATPKK
jgi:chromosome segregation ATPase